MESIHIKGYHGAYYIPSVDFDVETGNCDIAGESYLEDSSTFFTPLLAWLSEFLSSQNKKLTFNFKLEYYNTSSSKYIVDILLLFKKYQNNGKDIQVNWYYNNRSEDAEEEMEEVEDFMLETGIKINLVPVFNPKK